MSIIGLIFRIYNEDFISLLTQDKKENVMQSIALYMETNTSYKNYKLEIELREKQGKFFIQNK